MANSKSLIVIMLFFQTAKVYCQGELVVVDQSVNPGLVIEEFRTKDIIKGAEEYFINDRWENGNIYLKSGQVIVDYPIKYDIFNYQVELMVNEQIKICPNHEIDYFSFHSMISRDTSQFENTDNFDFADDAPLQGFFELIFKGTYSLYSHHKVEKKQPNYNEALNMGDKREKLVRMDSYYIVKDKKVLCELTSNVKKLDASLFPATYSQDTTMKTKSESQKISFLKYLNSL